MKSFSDFIVDSNAILFNIKKYKKLAPKSKICAVVKANGYGLGIDNFVNKIEHHVDFFAVACFLEAIKLRQISSKPILILNFVSPENLQTCANKNISVSIFKKHQLNLIKKHVKQNSLKVHFAINTGMNRIGFDSLSEFKQACIVAKKLKNLKVEGVFTHFYNASNNKHTYQQLCIFNHFLKVTKVHFKNLIVHTSASDASVLYKQFAFDMIRIGISLYGYSSANIKLKPALTIRSKIINTCKIKKGDSVGYGKNFVAKKNMIIATIPLGYADGIFRSYSKKGKVIINNKFCNIVGNICMDMFMCDITTANAKIGDEVLVVGKNQQNKKIFADKIAKCCNTISYEVLTNIKQNRFNIIKK